MSAAPAPVVPAPPFEAVPPRPNNGSSAQILQDVKNLDVTLGYIFWIITYIEFFFKSLRDFMVSIYPGYF